MDKREEMMQKLLEHVRRFIQEHDITCSEAVHQVDEVSLDSLEFIEGCCDIVGYITPPE